MVGNRAGQAGTTVEVMKKSLLAVLALSGLLSACETLDNRLVSTLQGDRVFVNSLWARIGFTTELAKKDADELKRIREKIKILEALEAAQQVKLVKDE